MNQRARFLSCARLGAALLLAGSAHADVLTVDDDGPADFSVVADAVDAALPGDVIVVELGNYPGEELLIDKALTILGRNGGPRPTLAFGIVMQADVPFAMARIRASHFEAADKTSRIRLHGCSFTWVEFDHCDQVMLTRGEVKYGLDAVSISNGSVVSLAGVDVLGGEFSDLGYYGVYVAAGTSGLVPHVVLAGCDVEGGTAGGGFFDGDGGDAINAATAGAGTSVRGSSFHTIQGGIGHGGINGASIVGNVAYSGVTASPEPFGLAPQDPPEPYLINASALLGESAEVELFGPAGQPALLLGSVAPVQPFSVSGWDGGRVWVNPAALVLIAPVTLNGQDEAAITSYAIPDDETLIGLAVDLQAIAVMPSSRRHLTNPGQFLVRP